MAQSRVFSLIGDSNVRNHMNDSNCLDRPLMSGAQNILCTKISLFQQSLTAIRSSSNVCIVSCVSNFIADSVVESPSTMINQRIEPVLKDFFSSLVDTCKIRSDCTFLVCPPMYRRSPVWYREGLPDILTKFSSEFAKSALLITNLFAMPSFPTPSFEQDGVHLTAYSGYEFVLHLFSRAQTILTAIASNPGTVSQASGEDVRVLQDRVMVTEQDLRRLNKAFDLKTAEDAELACYRANERNEDSLIISGLGRIRSGLSGREWQARAQDSVMRLIKPLTSEKFRIIVVHNITGRGSEAVVTYSVRLDSKAASRSIRSKFSGYFKGGKDSRPTELKEITIRNVITKETRIRLLILKMFGQKYVESNTGAKFQVIGYEPRPMLKLTPPEGSSDKRVKTFTFMEAVRKLPTVFPEESISKITRQAASQFPGRIRSLFVVLSDDDKVASSRTRSSKRGADDASESEPPRQKHSAE